MNRVALIILFAFLVFTSSATSAQIGLAPSEEDLKRFSELRSKYTPKSAAKFQYKAESNRFGHLTRPWETSTRSRFGEFSVDNSVFLNETVVRESGNTETQTNLKLGTLRGRMPNGEIGSADALRTSCRYTPLLLLKDAARKIKFSQLGKVSGVKFEHADDMMIISGSYAGESYAIYCSRTDSTLNKIVWKRHHEMWGDQKVVFTYANEIKNDLCTYANSIKEETFGATTFKTLVLSVKATDAVGDAKIPAADKLAKAKPEPTVKLDKFSSRITFLELPHTESRTTLVEFKDFLMVIDAPISSENGQLLVDKVNELGFHKPIKYFAFGHHHPHYLGGVRPFVAAGATVLTTEKVERYVEQVASFQHSIKPDALQEKPQPLKTKTFAGMTIITDGQYSVEIYDIGMKSEHTIDYLLFYFPEEKMLLQGDGIWLKPHEPVRSRTRAIYNAIQERNLEVEHCIQGWPTVGYGVPTKITFSELEQAVNPVNAAETPEDEKEEPEKLGDASHAAFAKIQLLVGKWKRTDKNEFIEYRMIARDSVLIERWTWPDRNREGMTVYHMDGPQMMATHYCPARNQPRLLFEPNDSKASHKSNEKFVFKFVSGTNLQDRTQSYCAEFWLQPNGKDSLTRSESYTDFKGLDVSEAEYVRVKDESVNEASKDAADE